MYAAKNIDAKQRLHSLREFLEFMEVEELSITLPESIVSFFTHKVYIAKILVGVIKSA